MRTRTRLGLENDSIPKVLLYPKYSKTLWDSRTYVLLENVESPEVPV